jgi:hypothetical protein
MAVFNWKQFLTDYSRELASRQQLLDRAEVPSDAREKIWFGYPPATDEQITDAEQSLGIQLPEGMHAFYRVTNGWMLCGHSIYDIKPIDRLCWLSDGSPYLWSLCKVNAEPPYDDDEDEREWWYEQGVKVCRSLMLNGRGDDSTLLFDPQADPSTNELRFGTWAAWNPGMEWCAISLEEFFEQSRGTLAQMDG